jgi:hypothetical protein
VSAANVHDSKMMLATVDAIEPIRAKTRGRPRRRPLKIRYEHRADIHLAFLQLGRALVSLRFLR